jgi:hypothetical protein
MKKTSHIANSRNKTKIADTLSTQENNRLQTEFDATFIHTETQGNGH